MHIHVDLCTREDVKGLTLHVQVKMADDVFEGPHQSYPPYRERGLVFFVRTTAC